MGPTPPLPRWPGALLVAALAIHAFAQLQPPELLWSCHVATAAMALGFFLRAPLLVASGLAFHAGEGLPAWFVGSVQDHFTATSVLVHLAPLACGAAFLGRTGMPRRALALAALFHLVPLAAARLLTPPPLDVDLAFHRWQGPLPQWAFQAGHVVVPLCTIAVAWLCLRRAAAALSGRRAVPPDASPPAR